MSQGSTRTICTVWYSAFWGGWLIWAPKNISTQNFVFTVFFGHNLDPMNHWNHINICLSIVGSVRWNERMIVHQNLLTGPDSRISCSILTSFYNCFIQKHTLKSQGQEMEIHIWSKLTVGKNYIGTTSLGCGHQGVEEGSSIKIS